MRIMSYSPSVEAYVAVSGKGGAISYYDISPDITRCSVSRKSDGTSTFDMRLQNKNGKYNNLFTPMDRITIYATKRGERCQLLTGYINTVTRFTLYPEDFSMSGNCSLYKLQNLWWDSGLVSSYKLLTDASEMSISKDWTNYSSLIYKLVCVVGGMPSNIMVGEVPQSVIDWARNIFAAKQSDYDDMRSNVEAFYEVLSKTNVQIASGSVDLINGDGLSMASKSYGDGASYHQQQGNGSNCGATAFTVALNMMLNLKGKDAYDNVDVWSSSAFGCDSTVNLDGKGYNFLVNEGLSSRISFYAYDGDITNTSQLQKELKSGHLVVISSGQTSKFLKNDGSYATYGFGHFIMFYGYDGSYYYCNDSACSADLGAGVMYSESAMQSWLDGRSYHAAAIMALRS